MRADKGGCGTVHANTAESVPARLEALACTAGLDRPALHSQLAAALDAVIHVVRAPSGRRRVAEVHLLERRADGLVQTVPAVVFDPDRRRREAEVSAGDGDGGLTRGPAWGRLLERCGGAL